MPRPYRRSLPIDAPEALLDVELPDPVATGRDLLVEIRAISVNPVDTKVRRRAGPDEPGGVKVLGYDAAGVVRATGPEATLFRPGDEVFYAGSIARQGTNAELHLVDERIVAPSAQPRLRPAAALRSPRSPPGRMLFDRLDVRGPSRRGERHPDHARGRRRRLDRDPARPPASPARRRRHRLAPRDGGWVEELGAHHAVDPAATSPPRSATSAWAPPLRLLHHKHRRPPRSRRRADRPQGPSASSTIPRPSTRCRSSARASRSIGELMFTRSLFRTADMEAQHGCWPRSRSSTRARCAPRWPRPWPDPRREPQRAHALIEAAAAAASWSWPASDPAALYARPPRAPSSSPSRTH